MPIQRKCQFTLVRGQRIGQRCDVRVPKNAATNHCRRHCPPPPVIGAPMIVLTMMTTSFHQLRLFTPRRLLNTPLQQKTQQTITLLQFC